MSREHEQSDIDKSWNIKRIDDENKPGERARHISNSGSIDSLLGSKTSRYSTSNGFSNAAFDQNNQEADRVTQLASNRYMVQRRGTKIFVEGIPRAQVQQEEEIADSKIEDETTTEIFHPFSWILSGLYAMVVVISAFVMKISQFITDDLTAVEVHWFYMVMYFIGAVWLVSYNPIATSCFKKKEKLNFSKSSHVNNRWLKGVLALFGLAIIIKNGLQLMSFFIMDDGCSGRYLYISLEIVHSVFILAQINYLFKYSKVFTQDFQALTRFGVMHVLATNLTMWINVIIDETAIALSGHDNSHDSHEEELTTAMPLPHAITQSLLDEYNLTALAPHVNKESLQNYAAVNAPVSRASGSGHSSILYSENCSCSSESSLCATTEVAEAFLYPFVIEFSLVASCLLYMIWSNVGKSRPIWEYVIKPSYKLYRSYGGVIAGAFTLFATILIIVVLGTTHSEAPVEDRDFFSEIVFLNTYNTFLIVLETLMIVACVAGFYLFKRIPHNIKKDTEELDAILLLVCLIGPLFFGIFSLLAVLAGNENKTTSWILTLGLPLSDILQCVIQVIFLLDGLRHEPVPSEDERQTAGEIEQSVNEAKVLKLPLENMEETKADFSTFRTRSPTISSISARSHITSGMRPAAVFAASLAHMSSSSLIKEEESLVREGSTRSNTINFTTTAEETGFCSQEEPCFNNNNNTVKVKIDEKQERAESIEIVEEPKANDLKNQEDVFEDISHTQKKSARFTRWYGHTKSRPTQPTLKIVAETHIAAPDRYRLVLRNVVIFLLIANSSLWVFSSLEGTAFVIYLYQSVYYGKDIWTIIWMISRPFSIFFRMHSAGCLFEIWSFA